MIGDKKLLKHLTNKSFSVFGGVPLMPLSTLKLLSAKCFIIFFNAHEKYILYNFKIFCTTICLYCSIMFFISVKH